MVTSAAGMRLVDLQFVVSERNWARASIAPARGGGEEPGGAEGQTIWSPEVCRRPWQRRLTVTHGGSVVPKANTIGPESYDVIPC